MKKVFSGLAALLMLITCSAMDMWTKIDSTKILDSYTA
jgi:hypothetical protein